MPGNASYPQTVLIVDDDAAIVQLVGYWLARAWPGHVPHLVHATTLREALECLQDASMTPPIDAMIVDCRLVDSVGLHAATMLIEAMDPSRAPIPAIVLTGTMSENDQFPALRQGVQAFLCKGRVDLRTRLPEALREGWERHRFWEERFNVLRKPRRA